MVCKFFLYDFYLRLIDDIDIVGRIPHEDLIFFQLFLLIIAYHTLLSEAVTLKITSQTDKAL